MIDGIPRPDELPPAVPHATDHAGRRICRALLRTAGWRLKGEFPDLARIVLIAAPHSSWWDGIWGLLMKVAIGIDVKFMAKQEIFHGPLGWLLRRLGGVPIDRSAAKGVVEQMVEHFAGGGALWLGITPEGTRRHVQKWKSGFWHIAEAARVPIFPVAFHYPEKTIYLGAAITPGTDMAADVARLRAFYAPYRGKYHGL